jgi:hypothetical protein
MVAFAAVSTNPASGYTGSNVMAMRNIMTKSAA